MATMIRITSKRAGFRRCGMAHPAQPTDYPATKFSAAQLKALQAEPLLVVQSVEVSDKKAEGGKK